MITGFLCVALLATASPEPPAAGATDDVKVRAVEAQKKANELYKAGRYDEALAAALYSYSLLPSARTAYNVGLIQKKLGQKEQAFERFAMAMDMASTTEEREQIEKQLVELGPALSPPRGWLRVESEPGGASIAVSPGVTTVAHTPFTLSLVAGAQRLVISLANYQTIQLEVTVQPGKGSRLVVKLKPVATAVAAGEPAPIKTVTATEPTPTARPSDQISAPTAPPPAQPAEPPGLGTLFWAGIGVGALGALVAVGCGASSAYFNSAVADPAADWSERELSAQLGLGAVIGTALGLLAGGAGTALAVTGWLGSEG
ncbi:MAG: PEGA domain-containing protein [Deltaproteobacteria bacterium]|nr:PEGA domain-containing protein [Deltaproteobacteria bacterium]